MVHPDWYYVGKREGDSREYCRLRQYFMEGETRNEYAFIVGEGDVVQDFRFKGDYRAYTGLEEGQVEFLLSLSRDEALECAAAWWGEVIHALPG